MAASYLKLARSVLLKGVRQVPSQSPWRKQEICARPMALQCSTLFQRPSHFSSGSTLYSSNTRGDPQRITTAQKTTDTQTEHQKPEEEEYDGPEYIPKRKAKNPMVKIGYAWMIGLPTGVIGFVLAKREVDKNRLKQLRVRQRMKRSNDGDYEGSRYRGVDSARLD